VKVGAVALPLASVETVAVVAPPANVALAPFAAAVTVNVTETPLTPLPPLSTTVATREANAVLMATLCEAPLVAVMVAAAPALLVKVKAADVETPVTLAFTV